MAGANKEPPLDETVWANPLWAGMINPNNVLNYFLGSPFFDRASNNASLFMQAQNPNNYQLHYLLQNRAEFEARLRTMVGIEFVVAMEDPAQGVYIIKKQLRKNPDEATALEAYFIIGENIIMAPTVYSVLMNRMLSSLTLISKAHSLAASMSSFTPDSGYSYPDNAPASSTSQTNVSLSQTSVASTPVPSGAAAATAAGTSSSTATSSTEAKSAQQRREEASLLHSLSLSLRFASGQPGGFLDDNNITDPQAILVSTSASSSQQQHGQGSQQGGSSQGSGGGSQQQQPPKLDIKAGKDSKGKGGAGSPTSPTSPTNTNTMKKRRKSKAAPAAAASQD